MKMIPCLFFYWFCHFSYSSCLRISVYIFNAFSENTANTTRLIDSYFGNSSNVVSKAIGVASSSGYPYTPVLIAGKAMDPRLLSPANPSEFL